MFAQNHYVNMITDDSMDIDIEVVKSPNKAKRLKMVTPPNNGKNIVNKIQDPHKFAEDFVNFYLNNILKQNDYSMINKYTEIKYNKCSYRNKEIFNLLQDMGKFQMVINSIEVLPSGSRRFDIQTLGKIGESIISQSFLLNNEKGNIWKIKSSIICTM